MYQADPNKARIIECDSGDFFHPPMEITDIAIEIHNRLTVEFQNDAQHAMCRRMLRPHVEDHLGLSRSVSRWCDLTCAYIQAGAEQAQQERNSRSRPRFNNQPNFFGFPGVPFYLQVE